MVLEVVYYFIAVVDIAFGGGDLLPDAAAEDAGTAAGGLPLLRLVLLRFE